MGFIGGIINPSLYMKKSAKGIVYIALYIEDNSMIGNMATIYNTIEALKNNGLVLKNCERAAGLFIMQDKVLKR